MLSQQSTSSIDEVDGFIGVEDDVEHMADVAVIDIANRRQCHFSFTHWFPRFWFIDFWQQNIKIISYLDCLSTVAWLIYYK